MNAPSSMTLRVDYDNARTINRSSASSLAARKDGEIKRWDRKRNYRYDQANLSFDFIHLVRCLKGKGQSVRGSLTEYGDFACSETEIGATRRANFCSAWCAWQRAARRTSLEEDARSSCRWYLWKEKENDDHRVSNAAHSNLASGILRATSENSQ